MKQFDAFLAISALLSLAQVATAANNYPIILVHGLSGWGRDEMAGIKYWGGLYGDYQEELKSQGFTVYTAAVGPFSSNWDRACELYAQIKGGRVDYGANHSSIHGHLRYGRTFPGLYPQWGTTVNGKIQKVHLVGHSMGGQTIRMLAQMLKTGTKGSDSVEAASSHPLFAGGKDWVHSITTISTPNQGTTIADGLTSTLDLIEDAIAGLFGVAGVVGSDSTILYDAKLDQWGLSARSSGESLSDYINRVFSSRMFAPGFKDISAYSLTTYGAASENKWVTTLPNVYYYSYITTDTFDTYDVLLRDISLPHPFSMAVFLQPTSVFIGSRFTPNEGFPESWQPNDGLVNVPSQYSDGKGRLVDFSGSSTRGVWTRMATLDYTDHIAVIGFKVLDDMIDLYSAHAAVLKDLPAQESLGNRRLQDAATHSPILVTAVQNAAKKVVQNRASQSIDSCKKATASNPNKALCDLYLKSVNSTV